MTLTSKDEDLLDTARVCLGLKVSVTSHRSRSGGRLHRLQWSDRACYAWLASIGLMPAKSLRLGPLQIPDELFADFLRGCIDGDGSIITYTDRYNTFKNPKYVYERLFVELFSASRPFLVWIHATLARLCHLRGAIITRELEPPNHAISVLKYAKRDSIQLLRWIYYAPNLPCLERKRAKAMPFLR